MSLRVSMVTDDKRIFWFLVWCGALVVVWSLGRSEAVAKAMLLFFAAGVVPGINKVLSPNQVFWLIGSLFGLAMLLIFSREIGKLFHRKSRPVAPTPITAEQPELPEPLVIAVRPRPSNLQAAAHATRNGLLRTLLAIVALFIVASEYAVRAWRWSEPYIRRFDHWIEATLKRNERIAHILTAIEGGPKASPPREPQK